MAGLDCYRASREKMTLKIRIIPRTSAHNLAPPRAKKTTPSRENLQSDTGLPICIGTMGFDRQSGRLYPIRCKQWHCPTCAKLNALDLAIRVVEGIKHFQRQGRALQFITLTAWGRYTANPALAYAELPKWWDSLRNKLQYLNRKSGGPKIEYAAFIEVQRRGVPHLHAIAVMAPLVITVKGKRKKKDKQLKGKAALKLLAIKSGWAHQADIQPVRGKAAGWYVAKYLTKGGGAILGDPTIPKGHKRVRFSEGWPPSPKADSANQLIVKEIGETYVEFAARAMAEIPHLLTIGRAMQSIEKLLNAEGDELTFKEYSDTV